MFLFTGSYTHSLDQKNRLFIPAQYRKALGNEFIIAPKLSENCLCIYTMEEWQRTFVPYMDESDTEHDAMIEFFCSNANQVSPDSQGRVVIPPELVRYASIKDSVTIRGAGRFAVIRPSDGSTELPGEEQRRAMLERLNEMRRRKKQEATADSSDKED